VLAAGHGSIASVQDRLGRLRRIEVDILLREAAGKVAGASARWWLRFAPVRGDLGCEDG
jgi:hypothetical protein